MDKERYIPHMVFCFSSLKTSLQRLVLRSGFIAQCESTRSSISSLGFTDIFDGKVFQSIDGHAFLSVPMVFLILTGLNHLNTVYHWCDLVLNLPRSILFQRENVILYRLMRGPSEPSLTVNSYLAPLVAELLDLWSGVLLTIPGSNSKVCSVGSHL